MGPLACTYSTCKWPPAIYARYHCSTKLRSQATKPKAEDFEGKSSSDCSTTCASKLEADRGLRACQALPMAVQFPKSWMSQTVMASQLQSFHAPHPQQTSRNQSGMQPALTCRTAADLSLGTTPCIVPCSFQSRSCFAFIQLSRFNHGQTSIFLWSLELELGKARGDLAAAASASRS